MTAPVIKIITIMGILVLVCSRVVYPQGLWPMNAFGQFSTDNQQILAYYDLNRDRFVDIITWTKITDNFQLRLYVWNQQQRTFSMSGKLDLGPFKPDIAIPADVVQDGTIDMLLTMQLLQSQSPYKTLIYCIDCANTTCKIQKTPDVQVIESVTLPTVIQIRAQNIVIYTNKQSQLRYMVYKKGKFYDQDFIDDFFVQSTDDVIASVCAKYVQFFYIDYNGDCIQDIIIHCNNSAGMADIQFYKGNDKGLFKPQSKASIDPNFKLLNIAVTDVNFDGLMDIVQLTRTETGQLLLEIHYNTAVKEKLQICKITITQQTSEYFPFHFIKSDAQLNSGVLLIQRIPLNLNYQQWALDKLTTQNFYIRPGDINSDGYFDLIIDGPNKAILLINQQCMNDSCGTYNSKFMEKWALGKVRIFALRNIDGMNNYEGKICEMSFLDIHQDGRLDIMSNLCPLASFDEQPSGRILAVYNSLPIDAFFLKITVLENLENQIIKSETMDKKLNTFGAHADFYVTALNGQRVPASGNQLSHPGKSLELPYILNGLGRTNNYVQSVTITISGKQSTIFKTWGSIVPNSQLIIVPGPKWILQTYISPTSVMAILFWFVVLILVLLGFWIARLTRRQKIQDKQNQDSFYSILR